MKESKSIREPVITSLETDSILSIRAEMLGRIRDFFQKKKVWEVDCPHLIPSPSFDPNISLFRVEKEGYLHSSPEYAMKRLLAYYKKDIYQLGHVFRKNEKGVKHLPEFTMAEWYRQGFTLKEMAKETAELCSLFLPTKELEFLSYRDAFIRHTALDPFFATHETLQDYLHNQSISFTSSDRDDLLDLILAYSIEPHLGENHYTIIYHYPKSQAALSKVLSTSYGEVALRFELYYQGVELANGYDEVQDENELRNRMKREKEKREKEEGVLLSYDEEFLSILSFLPPCCGVSVGVDRLFMLALGKKDIKEVIPLYANTSFELQEKSFL